MDSLTFIYLAPTYVIDRNESGIIKENLHHDEKLLRQIIHMLSVVKNPNESLIRRLNLSPFRKVALDCSVSLKGRRTRVWLTGEREIERERVSSSLEATD